METIVTPAASSGAVPDEAKREKVKAEFMRKIHQAMSFSWEADYLWRQSPAWMKSDRAIVLEVVQIYGWALELASEDIKNDKVVVLAAVKQSEFVLQYVSEELKNDSDIVHTAVGKDGWTLKFASDELRGDKNTVLTAVNQNGRVLSLATTEMKRDRDVVLTAIEQSADALQYASRELRNDKDVILLAIKQGAEYAFRSASKELQSDRRVALEAVKRHGPALQYASDELRNDKGIVLAAVSRVGSTLQFASDELRNDKGVVLVAVTENGTALQYASVEIQKDEDIVCVASGKSPNSDYPRYLLELLEQTSPEHTALFRTILRHIHNKVKEIEFLKKEKSEVTTGLANLSSRVSKELSRNENDRATSEDGASPAKRIRSEASCAKSCLDILQRQTVALIEAKEQALEQAEKAEKEKEAAVQKLECPICTEEAYEETYALVPCGHMMCGICADEYEEETCHICRGAVQSYLRLHK